MIDRFHRGPYLSALTLDRPLTLLDLGGFSGGTWPTRLGCNHALDSGPHSQSQAWARTIHRAHPILDGIAYRGRFAGELCVALFEQAADAFPTNPALSLPLSHIGLARRIDSAAVELGYQVVLPAVPQFRWVLDASLTGHRPGGGIGEGNHAAVAPAVVVPHHR